ncbi:hypothetical protein [Hydrogenivirga sp. 128-5-R1-1]|uniref:hypothetical protein n=1 Tax=Hydrogenivirga sp. 128-5-R1-1 TaxID=392423 RepID=UPI00015F345D|nr:hypothetical protein [Hydrogenivirga sp. 128-5-R1-1]EDP74871.1 hypothetical protein HG1285_13422 [Hydrogenivirga sp. 128-5-R1-1]
MIEVRKKEMQYVQEKAIRILNKTIDELPEYIREDDTFMFVYKKRKNSLWIRAYLVWKASKMIKGITISDEIIFKISSAVEMLIMSTYSNNILIDKKLVFERRVSPEDVSTKLSLANNIFLAKTIQILSELPCAQELMKEFYKVVEIFYIGQYINCYIVDYKHFDRVLEEPPLALTPVLESILKSEVFHEVKSIIEPLVPLNKQQVDNYLKNQLTRLYAINAHMIERFLLMPLLCVNSKEERTLNKLAMIGSLYGIGMQIVNDIIDFSLPNMCVEIPMKSSSDFFNDLSWGIITIPVFLGMFGKKSRDKIVRVLENIDHYFGEPHLIKNKEDILFALMEDAVIKKSLKIAGVFLKEARRISEELLGRDESLDDVFNIHKDSKFVVSIFRWYRRAKKEGRDGKRSEAGILEKPMGRS